MILDSIGTVPCLFGEDEIGFFGKVLELTGLILVGTALWDGIGSGNLGPELRLSVTGVLIFTLGWFLETRLTRRR